MTTEQAIKWLKGLKANEILSATKEALDIAIKALETGEVYMTGEDYNLYMEGYKSGLSDGRKDAERPQGEWISINERLPEYSGLYLISVDELVTVANFTGTYFMRGNRRVEVIAWQTLPEPYKEGGAE